MENDNISYNKTSDDMIQPIDTRAKDRAMNAAQKKKELYEKMKRKVEDAKQAKEQFHQQMREDAMNRPIKDYNINEYDEIEKLSKSR